MKQKKIKYPPFRYEKKYNQFFNLDKLIGNDINDVVSDRQTWPGPVEWTFKQEAKPYNDIEKEDRY